MSDDYEMFLGQFRVKKVNIVNDHRFIMPGTDEKYDVRPVSLDRLIIDAKKLEMQEIYVFPQPGDMSKKVFLVYYDRNVDLTDKSK